MESSTRRAIVARTRRARSREDRSGKVTLVTLVALLGMAVLIGYVGNAGHVVTAKVNSQNAADAVAFSSAQWMARGMNSVTATNHLLGEVTALVVVLEALGGPEADVRLKADPLQSRITDRANRALADMAIINGLTFNGARAARKVDNPFVNTIINKVVSRKKVKHEAFATIYDAKLTLKRAATKQLIKKYLANFGLFVPPWWGWLTAPVAYGLHYDANKELLEIGIEYVLLNGLEALVTNRAMRKLKVDVLENQIIPALAAHGDYLAGSPSGTAKRGPATRSGVVNAAVRDTLEYLGEVYGVQTAIYPTATKYPAIATLRLPIVPEAPPSGRGTRTKEPEWGSDKVAAGSIDNAMAQAREKIAENKEKARQRIEKLRDGIEFLEELSTKVDELSAETDDPNELAAFNAEQDEIAADIQEKRKQLADRQKDLQQIHAQERQLKQAVSQFKRMPPGSGNLSAVKRHWARNKMNQAEERDTQWVRATYPYVDAFRAPILKLFQEWLPHSEAAKHFEKWTNRYTLTNAWQFRSGFRFKKVSAKRGRWRKTAEPLHMYLLAERFDADNPPRRPRRGATRVQKGYETWTKNTRKGKKMAEEMFTVIGMTHREIEPLFSPVIYPVASEDGITTCAQAIVYNSNTQQPAPRGKKSRVQPKIGWDTLNWDPNFSVPEWGAPASVSATAKYPWEIFDGDEDLRGNAAVRLNWQAKLMPVTKSRFTQAIPAAAAEGVVEGDLGMSKNLGRVLPLFDTMVTH